MARKVEDRFANRITAKVVMSAADTLTWVEVQTGVSLGSGVGMLIDSVEYFWDMATKALMSANQDYLVAAWTTSNVPTDLNEINDQRIIHQANFQVRLDTAVGFQLLKEPHVYQFFPPLIVASPKVYLGFDTSGLASAGTVRSRMYFRYIELTDKEYLELAETNLLVG